MANPGADSRCSGRCARRGSDPQDDLAEVPVGLHVRLRQGRLVEAEDAVDRQPQLAGLDRLPQILPHEPYDLAHLLQAAGAEGDPDIVDAARGMEVEIELAFRPAEPADI